jgi:hypothetical protein
VALGGVVVASNPEFRVKLACFPTAEIEKGKNLYRNRKYGQAFCLIITGILLL